MRVAVTTTPGRGADQLGRLLKQAGMLPVYLPCIRIEPAPAEHLDSLRNAATAADWIILTSRRAVDLVWPAGDMPTAPSVAAVGPSTAEAVRAAGGNVAITGEGGAAALRDALAGVVDGSAVVFPTARAADPATARWLSERAARLTVTWAYETVPIAPAPDPVDTVIFGSPSAVTGWCLARTLDAVVIAAMGETTAAHLESAGHPVAVVPERPGLDFLVAALVAHSGERSTR